MNASAKIRDLLLARGEAEKPLIEKRSGRSFSSIEVAARFEVTAATVRSWRRGGVVVGCVGIPFLPASTWTRMKRL
jgi:hypothetical protein